MFSSKINSKSLCSFNSMLYNKQKIRPEFGLNKAEKKHLKRRITKAQSVLDKKHIYKSFQIKNKVLLAKHLANNEIYNEGGLIALIKPFGVRRYKFEEGDGEPKTVVNTLNSSGCASNISIEEALPLLKSHYNEKNLDVIFCPERWSSGAVLLSAHTKLTNAVRKAFRRSLTLQQPHLTYWAVVNGLTVPEAFAGKVGIHTHYVQNVGKVPLIKRSYSKGEVERGDVDPNVVEHVVRAHHDGNDMSLVEVNVLHSKRHFVRVWLSDCLAPAFGDLVFGGRVREVLGKKVMVSRNNGAAYQPPDIRKSLLSKLDLSWSQVELIPLHLHLSKLTLRQFGKGGADVAITASPPDHFMWTCRRLGLMAGEEEGLTMVDPAVDTWEGAEEEEEEEAGGGGGRTAVVSRREMICYE